MRLTARLVTSEGGEPIEGASLTFSNRIAVEETVAYSVGLAETDDDGAATYVSEDGAEGLGHFVGNPPFEDERLIGYIVLFEPTTQIGGIQYCRSRAEAPIAVQDG